MHHELKYDTLIIRQMFVSSASKSVLLQYSKLPAYSLTANVDPSRAGQNIQYAIFSHGQSVFALSVYATADYWATPRRSINLRQLMLTVAKRQCYWSLLFGAKLQEASVIGHGKRLYCQRQMTVARIGIGRDQQAHVLFGDCSIKISAADH